MRFNSTKAVLLVGVLFIISCAKPESSGDGSARVPGVTGPVISAGDIPEGKGETVTLSNGADIFVQNIGGQLYFQAEGAITGKNFRKIFARNSMKPEREKEAILQQELTKVTQKLSDAGAIPLYESAQVGYFQIQLPYSSEVLSPLKKLRLKHSVVVQPIVHQPQVLEELRDLNPEAAGLTRKSDSARSTTEHFSGLKRMRALEFVQLAEKEIGEGSKVDGSRVRVGVTDTGITYHHPSFTDEQGQSRVTYMKDFTREGRVYFNKSAKFEVKVPETGDEDLLITAQVIITPRLPSIPAGDIYLDLEDFLVKVSPELKSILTKEGSGAKLGLLLESSMSGFHDRVDLNGDGDEEGKIFMILIPGNTPEGDKVYIDPTGTGDFRKSVAIGDWNQTHQSVQFFAEKVGLDIRDDYLPSLSGLGRVSVRSASIVGFDPGSHGTHVTGIIGGRKTIANDSEDTLARGVVPNASLLVNRVCANNGGCSATAAFIDLVSIGQAEVVNMSLGGLSPFNDGYSVQEEMINRLSEMYNVSFIISAGNSGPGRQTVGSPSTAQGALSVGATATRNMIARQYQWPGLGASELDQEGNADFMLFFSSRGPTAAGGFKPNISAPGTELSAVQLNSAPGSQGGLDVYWGTSMAAPAATGAYALLLDAVKKYNDTHPEKPLSQDASVLRSVLIQSARPFDVSSFDPQTGERHFGQYTWIDQGTGMVDLVSAWKLLFQVRDHSVASSVRHEGESVELNYDVIVPMRSPQGIPYDGSIGNSPVPPRFGKGVYLSYSGTEAIRSVGISRSLPKKFADSELAGELTRQLRTTQDEFVIKTVIYGSDVQWLSAGSLQELGCDANESPNFFLIGEGALVRTEEDGTGSFSRSTPSSLNLCIDRKKIKEELQPGDHGALIYGYRLVNGRKSPLASFVVPVALTVPNHVLAEATAFDVSDSVRAFGVKRNYVTIPKGTTLAKVSLEVPAPKVGEGPESCSGVELMALTGSNVSKPFRSRADARISNCSFSGEWDSEDLKRKLTLTILNPEPGVWDLPVFGLYTYRNSEYKLRVDYLNASSSVTKIAGGIEALTGHLDLNLQESSMNLEPSSEKTDYVVKSLVTEVHDQVAAMSQVFVGGPLGQFRSYPEQVKNVRIKLGDSPGNDIDLVIKSCDLEVTDLNDPSCEVVATGDGPTDEESVSFEPLQTKKYTVRVDGVQVNDEGEFKLTEFLDFAPEKGSVTFTGENRYYDVNYRFSMAQVLESPIFQHPLFASGEFQASGYIHVAAEDGTIILALPVVIHSRKHDAKKELTVIKTQSTFVN